MLLDLAERVGRRLLASGRRMASAESCTGGWIAKTMTDVPGSSQWFDCGYVTYSNGAKMRDIGVSRQTLDAHGAVSEATVREMAVGALRVSGAHVAVSVSGVAGPDGGTPAKPVGTVWFAVASRHSGSDAADLDGVTTESHKQFFDGDREVVRRRSVKYALELVLQIEA